MLYRLTERQNARESTAVTTTFAVDVRTGVENPRARPGIFLTVPGFRRSDDYSPVQAFTIVVPDDGTYRYTLIVQSPSCCLMHNTTGGGCGSFDTFFLRLLGWSMGRST